MSILVASGFALYTYEMLEDSSAREFGHVTIGGKDYFTRDEETPMQYGIEDYQALTAKLLDDKRVRRVLPRVSLSGLISNGDKSVIFLGIGADIEAEAEIRGQFLQLVEGVFTRADDGLPAVLLGTDLARSLNAKPGIVSTGWRELLARLDGPRPQALRWLRVGNGDAVEMLDVQTVDRFEAADKYTTVHAGSREWLIRMPLKELERQLDADAFWRVHRGTLLRVAAIKRVQRDLMGRWWAELQSGGAPVAISRRYAHLFRQM